MTKMRAMIADDEPLANERLVRLLETSGEVEVVYRASQGEEVLETIDNYQPQLLFLDVEMPRLDGFDVVDALSTRRDLLLPPLIIFVTAYPDFAMKAFDTGAADFLSKPVRLTRLQMALQRARQALQDREAQQRLRELTDELETLRELQTEASAKQELWIRHGKEVIRVDLEDIERAEAEGEYVRLHGKGRTYLQRGPIGALLENGDLPGFIRVHRSHAIKPASVKAIERNTWGGIQLLLGSGEVIPVGRKYRACVTDIRRT